MNQAKRNITLGIILAVGFGMVYWVVIPTAVVVPHAIKIAATAPDYWPKLISAGIAILGLAVLVQGFIQIRRHRRQPPGEATVENEKDRRSAFLRTTAAAIGLLVYYWLVTPIGIVAASMLALPGFALIYGEHRGKVLVPLALLIPVALYFFFTRVANIPMPLGVFG